MAVSFFGRAGSSSFNQSEIVPFSPSGCALQVRAAALRFAAVGFPLPSLTQISTNNSFIGFGIISLKRPTHHLAPH